MSNPRRANGTLRTKHLRRLRAEERPCWICGLPIDYSLPQGDDGCFECDEIVPVSRYWEGGYASAAACAQDFGNLAAAHRECNRWRGNRPRCEVDSLRAFGAVPRLRRLLGKTPGGKPRPSRIW